MSNRRRESAGELRRRVALLESHARLARSTDRAVEASLASGGDLRNLLEQTLPLLREAVGADLVFAQALNEEPVALPMGGVPEGLSPGKEPAFVTPDGRTVVRQFMVGGRSFGWVGAQFDAAPDEARAVEVSALVEEWSEVLDDHLAMLSLARDKHAVFRDVSKALSDPLLGRGLDGALASLAKAVTFHDLVLTFRPADGAGEIQRRWVRGSEEASGGYEDLSNDPRFVEHLSEVLEGDLDAVLEHLEIEADEAFWQEEILFGAREPRVIGRLFVGRRKGELGPGDKDLVQVFADCLRQRLVDFTREHAQLATCFPPPAVSRLLAEPGYRERFLAPREEEAAILYADISGFTRISETLLGTPTLIGRLVDSWAAAIVQAVWATGGVFDKMVGDCIIGLWGPPFFETSAEHRCSAALEAAERIRLVTRALPEDPQLPELALLKGELGVAIGLNYAPLYVGFFGPNDDYTGFSSGMNNAARLQGIACRDEILCMDGFVDVLSTPERFGDRERAKVKNVADALIYRKLL